MSLQVLILCALTLIAAVAANDSPPQILRDPAVLKLLATHYPGTVLQPTRRPNLSPVYSQGTAAGSGSHQVQYGTRIRNDVQYHKINSPVGPITNFGYSTAQNGSYLPGTSAPGGVNQYHSASTDDPRVVRWQRPGPNYQKGSDATGSFSAPSYQYSRPVYFTPKKTPIYHTRKFVKITDSASQATKYIKISPKIYLSKPVQYKKVYPAVYQPKYQQAKPSGQPFRRFIQTQAYPSNIKPVLPPYGIMPPRANAPVKGNVSEELHNYFHTTERTTFDYVDRPVTEGRNATKVAEYYDNLEDTPTGSASAYESSTRGYYGDRLYMSTQKPDTDRRTWSKTQEQDTDRRAWLKTQESGQEESQPEDDDDDTLFD